MVWILYQIILPAALLLSAPYYLLRMVRRGGYRRGFAERFAFYPARARSLTAKARRPVWVHAVSVGEVKVAAAFMAELRRRDPEVWFVLTTNTSTGRRLAERDPDRAELIVYMPLDLYPVMSRAMNLFRPERLVLVEIELWPNMIRLARRRGIPVSLINGRMSDRSCRGYARLRFLTRRLLPELSAVCVQGDRDAKRFIDLGAPRERVHVLGSAKYDGALTAAEEGGEAKQLIAAAGADRDAPVLVGGSTWPGEEETLWSIAQRLREGHPGLFVVLVPRHAERSTEIAERLRRLGARVARRSRLEDGDGEADMLLVDTTGELIDFYAAADVVFVGKSLDPNRGGQNPIEPAALGKPVVVGPHMENFPAVMKDLREARAVIEVEAGAALGATLERLLNDPGERNELGRRASELVAAKRGVLARTADVVMQAE
ncbi:3-deoxy-D-manno-octulosonic acid transferase [Kiritimatiella glycovorans]|uniref:3-deoxy-D-manno-octulosonic acid transferase n=1 Tax=Kiritimatiella glycovorans TaxID=1307763 RepID=A0A0G3EG04_9BACT|nr:3-deoxy-D-manno-octulosonic acid transferase [Kiritimatiella glycovorans]AKJ64302.1 3-deoxy-D-manno-octulosonic acid transferase [Kiritimatiella glycovorans]